MVGFQGEEWKMVNTSRMRPWQAVVILLLTVTISLNLRILFSQQPTDEWEKEQECQNIVLHTADVVPLNFSQARMKWATLNPSHAKVIGHHRKQKGFLTIGVSSIKRINGMTYLLQTITSLVERTTPRDKTEVVVVVFLADLDAAFNEEVVKTLTEKFMTYINMGFLQILQVSPEFYPSFTGLKHNFKDKDDRVVWRSKQVADFSLLFLYSRNISNYYIQIEDDVICAENFVVGIRDFIKIQKKPWAVLEFSELGFIGKLFKSSDLQKLAQFMLTFYDEQPIDWLIRYYRMIMTQKDPILRKPTLFQHMGLTSSFDTSKDNKLKDRFFDAGDKPWRGDDPPAKVISDLKPFETFTSDLAYAAGSGYFWAKEPKKGNAIYLIFENDEKLHRVAIETGHPKHPNDILKSGTLEASPKLLKMTEEKVLCADLVLLGKFEDGKLDVGDLEGKLHGRTTKCLKITVGADQSTWMVLNQIAVFNSQNSTKHRR